MSFAASFRALRARLVCLTVLALAAGCSAPLQEEEATGASSEELRARGRDRDRPGRGDDAEGLGGRPGGFRDRPGSGRPRPPRPPWHGHGRGPQEVTQPEGAYFINVTANGTGCPDGTWDVAISEDGETFTLRFNAYEATIAAGQAVDLKDCRIDIQLRSGEGTQFAVAQFAYQGFVFLEKDGMSAEQSANYFFRRVRPRLVNTNQLRGPKEESYIFTDDIRAGGEWSACGRDDTLHVDTRLQVRNDRGLTGEGYINSAVLDGAVFTWKMKWRRCRDRGR